MIELLKMTFAERWKIIIGESQETKEQSGGQAVKERLHKLVSCFLDLGI